MLELILVINLAAVTVHQAHIYFPSHRALPPFAQNQTILFGDRHMQHKELLEMKTYMATLL